MLVKLSTTSYQCLNGLTDIYGIQFRRFSYKWLGNCYFHENQSIQLLLLLSNLLQQTSSNFWLYQKKKSVFKYEFGITQLLSITCSYTCNTTTCFSQIVQPPHKYLLHVIKNIKYNTERMETKVSRYVT
jgi:hypothetical protein